jgi:TonB-linked SusC/RagA family outer membrane protein
MKKIFTNFYWMNRIGKGSLTMLSIVMLTFLTIIPASFYAQEAKHNVEGVVTDDTGLPLPGVNVYIKGTSTGTVTDFDGKYLISASNNDVLVFSFIGFMQQEVLVGDKTKIDIVLASEASDLDEVVVVGYGVTKKKLQTGANLNVKGENIQELAPDNAINALQGISPGLSLTKANGMPGESAKINIRGMGTIGNSNPLYIVDGVTVSDIDYLSPSDIESIDVLKDAASAAIYGSRAANGVILVTTKKGNNNDGKVNVSLNSYVGWQNVYKMPDVLTAQEYALMQNEARLNDGLPLWDYPSLVPNWDEIESGEWQGTNWFDEMRKKNAMVQNYSMNMSWGNKKSVYSLGASYFSNDGVLGKQVDPHYKRITIRFNSDHTLYEKDNLKIIRFGENLTYNNNEKVGIKAGNLYYNDIRTAFATSPFLPLYDDQGNYHYAIPWNVIECNPIARMEYDGKYLWPKSNKMVGNVFLEVQPIKNLIFRTSYGFNATMGSRRHWVPAYQLSDNVINPYEWASQSMNHNFSYTFTNTLSYDFDLGTDHHFKALAGTEMYKVTRQMNVNGKNQNGIFGDPEHAYLDNYPIIDPSLTEVGGEDSYGQAILSYFGRISYNYKERYLLTFILRSDGSSNFAEGNRWGTFPSIAGGWVITNENFMKDIKGLDFLKLRVSWGQNGNQNIGAFQYSSTIIYDQASYFYGPDKTIEYLGGYPSRVPNPNVTWETSEQTDIGLDAYFLDSRLKLNFDWYNKVTKDWLVKAPILATAGTNPSSINGGEIKNTGVEVALGWDERSKNFNYSITGTFAYNHNEITEIANDEGIIHGPSNILTQGIGEIYRAQVGYPIAYFWGFQTDGILQNQAEADAYNSTFSSDPRATKPSPGDLRYVDQNNDGVIDDKDKIYLGDPNPNINYGIQINMEYKGVYLNFTGVGQAGMQITKSYRNWNKPFDNYTTDVFNRWHGEGTSTTYPKLSSAGNDNMLHMSDFFVENANFFRVSSLIIGYDLGRLNFWPLKQTKIYFQGQNLLVITNYSGLDPEVGYGPDDWASGIDIGTYPQPRTLLVGLQINF